MRTGCSGNILLAERILNALPHRTAPVPSEPGESRCRHRVAKQQKRTYEISHTSLNLRGAPREIRTPGLQVRSLLLYPAELLARNVGTKKRIIPLPVRCQAFFVFFVFFLLLTYQSTEIVSVSGALPPNPAGGNDFPQPPHQKGNGTCPNFSGCESVREFFRRGQ